MNKTIGFICLAVLFVFSCLVPGIDGFASDTILPEDLPIGVAFSPGTGPPVGRILSTSGRVIVVHEDMSRGYWAKNDLPVFEGDIIITRQTGQVQFQLNDDSVVTLAPDTKLTIDKSVFDPDEKVRNSLMQLAVGKAHFYVKKLLNFKLSDFLVKTPTATAGVRGSQWIMEVHETLTRITTEEKTVIEVWSPSFPEKKSTLTALEQTVVAVEETPTEPTKVSLDTIDQIKEDLTAVTETAKKTEPVEKTPVRIEAYSLPTSPAMSVMPTSNVSPVIEPSVMPAEKKAKAKTSKQAVDKEKGKKKSRTIFEALFGSKKSGKKGSVTSSKAGKGRGAQGSKSGKGGGRSSKGSESSFGGFGGGNENEGHGGDREGSSDNSGSGGNQGGGNQGGGSQGGGNQGGGSQGGGNQGGGNQGGGNQGGGNQGGGNQGGGNQGGGNQGGSSGGGQSGGGSGGNQGGGKGKGNDK